jgi:hypothetical protein
MAGGHLTGTLKLLNVVSDRPVPPGRVPRAQLASGYTIPGGAWRRRRSRPWAWGPTLNGEGGAMPWSPMCRTYGSRRR